MKLKWCRLHKDEVNCFYCNDYIPFYKGEQRQSEMSVCKYLENRSLTRNFWRSVAYRKEQLFKRTT